MNIEKLKKRKIDFAMLVLFKKLSVLESLKNFNFRDRIFRKKIFFYNCFSIFFLVFDSYFPVRVARATALDLVFTHHDPPPPPSSR